MIRYIDLALQHKNQKEEIIEALKGVLERGDFGLGKSIDEFEKKIAEYCGTKYAAAVNSGTDALTLAMMALGIKKGDEVITVSHSFIATVGAIVDGRVNATPVLVDIKKDYTIDENLIENSITSKTKAIIPVHWAGRICEMNKINEIAKKHNLFVIEDACQAIGAEYNGKRAGSLGDIGCFSLHPLKILNVLGDGGFITTNDAEIYDKIKKLRNHGLKNRNEADFFGFNSRLDTFHAAVALQKMNHLEEWINKRRENASLYKKELSSCKTIQLPESERLNGRDVQSIFLIQTEKRDELQKFLLEKGIEALVHYPIPIHLQKAASFLGYKEGSLPMTEKIVKIMLSLPVHQDLTKEEILAISGAIKEFDSLN